MPGMKENSGLALAIGAVAVVFFGLFPVLIVVLVYLFLTTYAIVKAFGMGGPHPNPSTILIGVVAIVGTLVTLLTVGVALLGRAMDAKKRREREIPGL
jgi:hypothetical protein